MKIKLSEKLVRFSRVLLFFFLLSVFVFDYAPFTRRALTNSGMLPVCFLLPAARFFLGLSSFFSSSFPPFFSPLMHSFLILGFSSSFVETSTPWQQKVLRIINTSFFLLIPPPSFSLLLTVRVCVQSILFFSFFSFCHQHCLNYAAAAAAAAAYSIVRDNFFSC